MEDRYKITNEKLQELKDEVDQLVNIDKKKLSDALQYERDTNTDLDDTTYTELLAEKEELEKRIAYIKDIIINHQIIKKKRSEKIALGSTVKAEFNDKPKEFTIVTQLEADPLADKLSIDSPVGKAIVGLKKGDEVDVDTGVKVVKIKIGEVS